MHVLPPPLQSAFALHAVPLLEQKPVMHVPPAPPQFAVARQEFGTLDANGAVVFAPVKVLCQPGSYTYLSVSVTENVGGDIASGTRSVKIDPCSGRQQSVRLAVTPTQKPFRKGVAFGQATLDSCDRTGCHTLFDEHNIQIVDR